MDTDLKSGTILKTRKTMPLTQLLQALNGTCRHCGQKAGFLRKQHSPCRDLHQAGFTEMIQLAAQAASAHTFNEAALRQTLGAPSPKAPTPPT